MAATQSDEISAFLGYADVLHLNGWTAEALRIYRTIAGTGGPVDPAKFQTLAAAATALPPEADLGRHQPLAVLRNRQVFSSLHFARDLTPYQKRVAFLSGVNFVNLETSSQCNRNCPYCPNAKYDRRGPNSFMDMDVYERVLNELAEIDYFRWIALVGLNEPLLHLQDFVARLKMIRAKLPRALIRIYTNGDFLDKAAFRALEDTGANELNVSIHLSRHKTYEERDILKRIYDKARELGLNAVLTDFVPHKRVEFTMVGGRMHFVMRQLNYMTEGHSRGDVMKEVGPQIENRTAPCLQPMDNFVVNYQCDVLPCCTTIGTSEEVKRCVVGNVASQSIFDVYGGAKMTGWRRHVAFEGDKWPPCKTCPEKMIQIPDGWGDIAAKALAIADGAAAG